MENEDRPREIFAHGKLLLTGEYFVLDGAEALALPVRFGQRLRVVPAEAPSVLAWKSRNEDGAAWFSARFSLPGLEILENSDSETAQTLQAILQACRAQNGAFLLENQGFAVETQNDFPRNWGLGTSSTLIAALSRWAGVDPYPVLFDTLGGSGYDLACAFAEGPILYRLDGRLPLVRPVRFAPDFSENLYFLFLGKKQNSREGIRRYRANGSAMTRLVPEISDLTRRFLAAHSLPELESIIQSHENLIASALDLPRAKSLYFNDFWGEVKSLGAWGGDFVLITSARPEAETRRFFNEKGFDVFMRFEQMV